jgi:hypothetical protein
MIATLAHGVNRSAHQFSRLIQQNIQTAEGQRHDKPHAAIRVVNTETKEARDVWMWEAVKSTVHGKLSRKSLWIRASSRGALGCVRDTILLRQHDRPKGAPTQPGTGKPHGVKGKQRQAPAS